MKYSNVKKQKPKTPPISKEELAVALKQLRLLAKEGDPGRIREGLLATIKLFHEAHFLRQRDA